VTANPYETDRYLQEYLLLHYGRAEELCRYSFVPRALLHFHERIRRECLLPIPSVGVSPALFPPLPLSIAAGKVRPDPDAPGTGLRAGLDLGCAVGRLTFELGRVLDRVLGIDNSRVFIQAARQMARRHTVTARLKVSGAEFARRPLTLPKALARGRVDFQQGDAADLRSFASGAFQVVAAINLLCRLPEPRHFLEQLPRIVAPGGQLVLGTPLSWQEEYTPRRKWLYERDIERLLRPHFTLARTRDIPFLIREHHRKYQLGISTIRVFLRNPP
jgi:SAM-dependent methyltransferase